jgi:predicted TIM-barrel fold metal-dependent hydrolase
MTVIKETDGHDQLNQQLDWLSELTVVDCDVHEIHPDQSVFEEYANGRWRDRIRHLTTTDEPLAQSLRGTYPFDVDPTGHGLSGDVSPLSSEGIVAFMDELNTDYIIRHGHVIQEVSTVPNKDYATAICKA